MSGIGREGDSSKFESFIFRTLVPLLEFPLVEMRRLLEFGKLLLRELGLSNDPPQRLVTKARSLRLRRSGQPAWRPKTRGKPRLVRDVDADEGG